ncbi:zinc finger protein [Plasmodium brasilianum]|uniref:C2H2-type domain-containing protein n=2 Tax=Plasmodium (Plasmodium) TaxID=418103 RepID=A0A1A8W6E5_PLAMA|nr:conserved Plasmodium protein, unknown function [Plasmodium malariae]KAI4836700.1 zinc finger protein [Plasmodium brasilianum]SBS88556.1 hypothetical protein, conserved [Plasmodium malariae]SCO93986.1 conserved Plasmodium protein, unknown function [Plasmodium malariae]
MNEDILNKYSARNGIYNTPYSSFFNAQKRSILEEDNINNDDDGHVNKKAKVSVFENFETLKKKKLKENDICIDHFKDMEKYIEEIQELKNIYNFLFSDNLSNSYDILSVNRKFCSIECNDDIIDKSIFFDPSTECFNNMISYDKSCFSSYVSNYNSKALIRKKKKKENTSNEGLQKGKEEKLILRSILKSSNMVSTAKKNTNNNDDILLMQLKGDKSTSVGKRFLNSVSNQLLYIDDLSMYDVLLLLSFVSELQNEQKENEKEERNLEIIANIDEFQINAFSLKDIYRYYYKERCFQCFTCGIRFCSSLEKLNHLEIHYKKNRNYMNSSEISSIIKSKKKFIFLDHMNISIEFFICKDYSFFEDLYDNVVTKNSNSFNFHSAFDFNKKTIYLNNNYDNLKNSSFLKSNVNSSDMINVNNELDGLNNSHQCSFPRKGRMNEGLNDNMEIICKNKKTDKERTLAYYIMKDYPHNVGNNICLLEENNVQMLFNFTKGSNDMDNFFYAKQNETGKSGKEKDRRNYIESNDIKELGENSNEMNFFDFICENQNTYDVYLSNYYTVTEDNNVLIKYIDGESMYKNIMKCLEIRDITTYEFPSWVPQRSIQNFFVKRITEMYQHVSNDKIYNNLLIGKNITSAYMNKYNMDDLKEDKLDVKNNLWTLCTNNDFYISRNLFPINIFFSTCKKKKNYDLLDNAEHGSNDNPYGEKLKRDEHFHNPFTNYTNSKKIKVELDDKSKEGINESFSTTYQNVMSKGSVFIENEKEKKCLGEEQHNPNSNEDDYMIFSSFINIFKEKYFLQTEVFKDILLFYLRKSYFTIYNSNNLKNNTDFSEIQSRLFNYIYSNYPIKVPIFDINSYHLNYCFLCKEKFAFDYSYEYNDFYYIDVISVNLNNFFFEEDEEGNYNLNKSAKRIDQGSEKDLYNEISCDILDKNINEAQHFLKIIENKHKENANMKKKIEKKGSSHTISCGINKNDDLLHIDSIDIYDIFDSVKMLIDENCLLRRTIIEPAVNYRNYHQTKNAKHINSAKNAKNEKYAKYMKYTKNSKRKDDSISYYYNLFKKFCIPYETLSVLHNIQKSNSDNYKINNNQGNPHINKEYVNEEVDKFIENFEKVSYEVTNSILEDIYKKTKREKNTFNEIIKCYIDDDNKKKENHNNMYFPSKNYTNTNFTYFHNDCFKNYIEYYIFPYYFLRKLDDKILNQIIILSIKSFFNAYQHICKLMNDQQKGTPTNELKKFIPKQRPKRRKHF